MGFGIAIFGVMLPGLVACSAESTTTDSEHDPIAVDSEWIAWKDRHQAYVAPMPALAGRSLNLDSPGVPKRRLSSDLGEFLSWHGQELSYAAGNTMWTVDLSQGLPDEQVTPTSA